MSEKPDQHTRLLADTFHENWTEGPVALYAREAAAQARRSRGLRQSFIAAAATAGIAAILVFSLSDRSTPRRESLVQSMVQPAYEIISDEELLTQLRDRPLLVMHNENGTRKFVLLDH